MIDEPKLKQVMGSVLGVDADQIDESTSADTVDGWGSLAQLNLILALEEEFGVTIPDEEAADLTSYPLIRLVLGEQVAA
jgi:acyl carrier protein